MCHKESLQCAQFVTELEAVAEARVTGHTTVCEDSKVGCQDLGACRFDHRVVYYWCISLLQGSQEDWTSKPLVQCLGSPILWIRIYCFRHSRKLTSSEALRIHCLCGSFHQVLGNSLISR